MKKQELKKLKASLSSMLGNSTNFDTKNQFLLKRDLKFTSMKKQGYHFILNNNHPVKSEWDKIVFRDVKAKPMKIMLQKTIF